MANTHSKSEFIKVRVLNFDPDRHKKSRWRNFEFFDGSVFGMLVGVEFALLLVWALDSDLTQEIENKIFDIATLSVVIFTAFVALGGVLMQLRAQSDLEEKRRKDELEAEVAALSFALVHVMKMSRKAIQELVGKDYVQSSLWVSVEMDVSETQLSSIKAAIRLTREKERHGLKLILQLLQPALEMLMSNSAQVYLSLAGSLPTDLDRNKIAQIERWVSIYCLSASLLNFSRGRSLQIDLPFQSEMIENCFEKSGIIPSDFVGLTEVKLVQPIREMNSYD